jgi:hypothetical protein
MRSGRLRAGWPVYLDAPGAGFFGLGGKLRPFLRECEPRSLADLVYCHVCTSPAFLCGPAVLCRKVRVEYAHSLGRLGTGGSRVIAELFDPRPFRGLDSRFRARTFSRLASRYLRLIWRVFSRFMIAFFGEGGCKHDQTKPWERGSCVKCLSRPWINSIGGSRLMVRHREGRW